MKRIVLIALLLLFQLTTYGGEKWQRHIENYKRNEYGGDTQNWMVKRSGRGWVYVANNDGLLEYDGEEWKLYPVKGKIVRSLNIVGDTIFIGSSTEFGFFTNNIEGKLTYRSLSEDLSLWGGEVWYVLDKGEDIYFISDACVHLYNREEESVRQFMNTSKINSAAFLGDTLYLGCDDALYTFYDEEFIAVKNSEEIADGKIVEILSIDDGVMLVTADKGLYRLEGDRFIPLRSIADDFIKSSRLFCAAVSGELLALGSVQNGLYIFNFRENSSPENYNLQNGLNNNTILHAVFDERGDLLLALDNGLAHVYLRSAGRPLFANISPIGTGYCSIIYSGELYLGTNQGLYRFNQEGEPELAFNIQGQVWGLSIVNGELFCSCDNGIYIISGGRSYRIPIMGAWEVQKIDSSTVVAGRYSGLSVIKWNGARWVYSHDIKDFYDSVRGFIMESEENIFWFIKSNREVNRLIVDDELTSALELKSYQLEEDEMGDNFFVKQIHDKVVVCTEAGVYGYSSISDSFSRFTELEELLSGRSIYTHLSVDQYNNIWYYNQDGLSTLPYRMGVYEDRAIDWGLKNELIKTHDNINVISPTVAIVATGNGFTMLDFEKEEQLFDEQAYIRFVTNSSSGEVLSYGTASSGLELIHKENAIGFQFSSNAVSGSAKTLYSYKLSGVDSDWSAPSTAHTKEYTNLREGDYQFEVRTVLNSVGDVGESALFRFTVLPPWYRSKLAFFIYSLMTVSILYIIYQKTIRRQQLIISQQQEEKIDKDKKIYELQNDKLKSELQFKSQELAGYILNMGRKNAMLEDVKRSAEGLSKAIAKEREQEKLKDLSSQLIMQIDKNLGRDDDFKAFQSNFDIVHRDFFQKLSESYPELTQNDKMLCAYIKMGLTSKEIAPIQGISIRSVEVSRYRLRKKLNIESGENLHQYLESI